MLFVLFVRYLGQKSLLNKTLIVVVDREQNIPISGEVVAEEVVGSELDRLFWGNQCEVDSSTCKGIRGRN